MTDEQELLKKRLLELADKAYRQSVYTHTGFLDASGLAVLASLSRALSHVPYTVSGGADGCERQMAQFGDEALCGYEAPLPISCVKIAPAHAKFADDLSHRDFLGALMHLGVERDTMGDIRIVDHTGYVFCTDAVAAFLSESLEQVSHTVVRCTVLDGPPPEAAVKRTPVTVQLASERLDSAIARVYSLSREESARLFCAKRVFLNSVPTENASAVPKPGDVVSVRGYGRFCYVGVTGTSRKGKLNVAIERYGD